VTKVGIAVLAVLLGLVPISCGAVSGVRSGARSGISQPGGGAADRTVPSPTASPIVTPIASPKAISTKITDPKAMASGQSLTIDPQLLKANQQFSFKLFQAIATQAPTADNVFVSPTSVALALSMANNGANGTTRSAIDQALQLNGLSLAALNQSNLALKTVLETADPAVRLNIANSLWARQGMTFNADFLQRNQDFYQAEVATLDFRQPESVGRINGWVKTKTQGKIPQIVDRLKPEDVMYLINAVYFKGDWSVPFAKSATKSHPFTLADGKTKSVPMMSRRDRLSYYETPQFQAVRLPYGQGRWSMYLFMPSKNSNLAAFRQTLTAANWQTWMSRFQMENGLVKLPKFKSDYEVELKSALTALGMGVAFDPDKADFGNLWPAGPAPSSSIDHVKHKTFVEVNESGTEAAAVTSIGIVATSAQIPTQPFEMILDRPFFCAIRDNETGTILFMGQIQNPEA
jgi:serine protease inhibitor